MPGSKDASAAFSASHSNSMADHSLHTLSKRSLRRQHHIIIERRPVSRGPPRRRRRPPKFPTSFRPKSRPKIPKPVYGPPNYVFGKPLGYVVMNQNNEIIHQSKDFSELPPHFFDGRIPPNFINDDPPAPYQEEPEIIPSIGFEAHTSQHRPAPPSLASEEVHTWTQYEEIQPKPKVRRKKPSTTPEPSPPSHFPIFSTHLKPQPPSTSYGVPETPFTISNYNPWLGGLSPKTPAPTFHKQPSFPSATRQKTPVHASFQNQFDLEQEDEKNLYNAPISSYDVPLNYVSTDTKPSSIQTFSKKPVSNHKYPTETFDVGSFEHNPSSSFQSYLPPQLPESYNDDEFPGVTRHKQQQIPQDYSGEYSNSEESLEPPLTFTFKKPTKHVTRKPVFRQTTTAQEAFENFVREIRPSLATTTPPTEPEPIYIPKPTTRRPRPPTVSHRPRIQPIQSSDSHNLDTDDLREAYIESSASQEDYNFEPEPISFESMRFSPHDSRPSASDKRPHNYVLVSSANREHHTTSSTENYPKNHPGMLHKPSNVDIISIQKSKSKNYYAGSTTPSTRPPRSNPRGSHRQYTKSQISRQDNFSLLHGENYGNNPPTTSYKFNPSLHFTKTFSSKITQPHHTNHKYQQQSLWNGQELPKNHKLTNRDI
ncbi:uncharacterized protein LOC129797310 isoform X2 [Lutzomyia longipalpis]|nr:uncharacterized protein LOC129797310 isoform X2 [Lutzomyia longipalpis]